MLTPWRTSRGQDRADKRRQEVLAFPIVSISKIRTTKKVLRSFLLLLVPCIFSFKLTHKKKEQKTLLAAKATMMLGFQ